MWIKRPISSPLLMYSLLKSGMVYEDAEKYYAEVRKAGDKLLDEAFAVLFPDSVALTRDINVKSLPLSSKIMGFNTTFFRRSAIIEVPLVGANSGLKSQVLQTSSDGKTGYAVMNCPGGGNVGALSTPETGLHAQIMPVSGVCLAHALRRGFGSHRL
jgi:alpha-mannosidase